MPFKQADVEVKEENIDLACQGCRQPIGHIIVPLGRGQGMYLCKDCHDKRRAAGVAPRPDLFVRHPVVCDCGCNELIGYADLPEPHALNATKVTVGHLTKHAPPPDKLDLVGNEMRQQRANEISVALQSGKITPVQAVMEILKLIG